MDSDNPDDEVAGEEDESEMETEFETIFVKLPNGKKVPMISPFDDEGDVPWLIPKNDRDLDYFEIPWDLLLDEDRRKNELGRLLVVCSQPITDSWLGRNMDGEPHPETIYKSRYDTYNGRHIIEALLAMKVPQPAKPGKEEEKPTKKVAKGEGEEGNEEVPGENEDDKEENENEDLKAASSIALDVARRKRLKSTKVLLSPKELKAQRLNQWRRSLILKLIEKIQEKQISLKDMAPGVIRWFRKAIEKEEKESARKKERKDRLKTATVGQGSTSKFYFEELEGEFGEEAVGLPQGRDKKSSSKIDLHTSSSGSMDDSVEKSIGKVEEEDLSELGEGDHSEKITFSEMEKEEAFLRKIKRREARERKEKRRDFYKKLKALEKQFAKKWEEIKPSPEYKEALQDTQLHDIDDFLLGWKPTLVWPKEICLGRHSRENSPRRPCTCDRPQCFFREKCRCGMEKCPRFCVCNKDKKVGEAKLPKGFISEDNDPLFNSLKPTFKNEEEARKDRFMRQKSYQYRMTQAVIKYRTTGVWDKKLVDYFNLVYETPRTRMTSSEYRIKYPYYLAKKKNWYQQVEMNGRTLDTSYIRGWINSPYYQFGVDSGILMPPTSEEAEERIEKFKNSPGYEAKKAQYGKIFEEEMLSEEKMQELVMLGVTESDPFLKDYLDFLKSEREANQNQFNETWAALEENPELFNRLIPKALQGASEPEREGGDDGEEEEDHFKRAQQNYVRELIESTPVAEQLNRFRTKATLWDEYDFQKQACLREKRWKQLKGEEELKPKLNETSLRVLFGQNFDKIWVHPENFKEFIPKKLRPTENELLEFQEFMSSWRYDFEELNDSIQKEIMKEKKKKMTRRLIRTSQMYVRAFQKRLARYDVIGEPPKFLVEALKESDDSYLKFLKKMKKNYLKHRKIDKDRLEKVIHCLEEALERTEEENRKSTAKRMESMASRASRAMPAEEQEPEGEDEIEGRREKQAAPDKSPENQKKVFKLLINKNYTAKELAHENYTKGPVIIDSELKGMTEEQVKELYKKHLVPISEGFTVEQKFREWLYSGLIPLKGRLELVKIHRRPRRAKTNALTHYYSLLHAAELIDDDSYNVKYSPKKFRHYVQPLSEISKCVDFPLLKYITQKEEFMGKESVRKENSPSQEREEWNTGFLKEWRIRSAKNTQKSMRVNEMALKRLDQEDVTSEIGETVTAVETSEKVKDPYRCKKEKMWSRVRYDPYACLRKMPRVRRKHREWYRSSRERELRAFREREKTFLKYMDINKLKENPEDYRVWKMISSGKLMKRYQKAVGVGAEQELSPITQIRQYLASIRQYHKVPEHLTRSRSSEPSCIKTIGQLMAGELWNWDLFGGGDNKDEKALEELTKFKEGGKCPCKTILSWQHRQRDPEMVKDVERKKLARFIRRLFKDSLPDCCTGAKPLQPENEAKRPEGFTVFTTVDVPPFALQEDKGKLPPSPDQKVEDRKLFQILRSCGTLIFDVTRSRHDMFVCSWYLRKLYLKMEKIEKLWKAEVEAKRSFLDKDFLADIDAIMQNHRLCDFFRPKQHIILITSFMSWANSPDEIKKSINEKNFMKRKPHQDYYDYYTFENLLHRIGKYKPFNLHTTLIYTGLPFGLEEDGLSFVFKMAYDNNREIPIYGPGDNFPPMVHITDLSKVVASFILPEFVLPMTFLVHPIRLSLKRRIFNIANQVSYAHVRTQPTSEYEWNNILPKTVHDMLQLNVRAVDVDLHEFMVNPVIESPFGPGKNGYRLFEELVATRGTYCRSIILIGTPSGVKLELAKSIAVFYNVPLLTRRNIMSEWLKLKQLIKEGKAIRKSYHKGIGAEEAEKEKDDTKRPQFGDDEMKQVVADNNCDVNRNWILFTLRLILRTRRYRRVGYVLCDIPLSEKDAEFLFNNMAQRPDPREFRNVSTYVRPPDKVIFIQTDTHDFYSSRNYADPVLDDDVKDFLLLVRENKDAQEFFKKRLIKIHRVNTRDEYLLEKVIDIIGPPPRPGGIQMFRKLMSRTFEDEAAYIEGKKQAAHTQQFFNVMQQKGLDLAPGLTHQCFPSLRDWPKLNLKKSLQPFYKGFRHYHNFKMISRSKAGPYREVKRKWANKSAFFNQMPTEGKRSMWKRARKFWPPQEKTKEYINQFEVVDV